MAHNIISYYIILTLLGTNISPSSGTFEDDVFFSNVSSLEGTPPKINIDPENDGLEDVAPFPGVYSQVPC